jgi:hypothetical protein
MILSVRTEGLDTSKHKEHLDKSHRVDIDLRSKIPKSIIPGFPCLTPPEFKRFTYFNVIGQKYKNKNGGLCILY